MINRRALLLVVIVAALTVVVGAGTAAGQSAPDCSQVSYNGDGTEQNPYEVGNVDQLQCIVDRETETEFGDHFVQVSDIDATETENWNNGNGFGPIEVFHGSFDGNGYQITGLTIDRTDEYHVGLFRRFPLDPGGADIDDIHLVNVDIRGAGGGGAGVGALVGEADEFSVTNSSVAGTITGFGNNIGGMVGRSYSSTIAYSHADVDVTNADSEAFGTGGVIGRSISATVRESYSTGDVNGGENVGGLVGSNGGAITDSYAEGDVTGANYVGALAGLNKNGATISQSYAIGSVSVDTGGDSGGLVGGKRGTGTTFQSYWDTETTGQTDSAGGTGLTTSEMTGSAATGNMQGFDFMNTWETVTNPDGYPVLRWQTESNPEPANFDVSIATTNSPVQEGGTLTVDATVTNTGGQSDSQTIELSVGSLGSDSKTVSLDGEGSDTATLSVRTSSGDAGTYTATVSSDDDTASTTVEVTSGGGGGGGEITTPLPGFANPPQNIPTSEGGLDDKLVEDLDGDGEVTDIEPTVKAFGKLIRGESLGLTAEQAGSLDWDEDNGDSVDIDDMVALFGRQIRAG